MRLCCSDSDNTARNFSPMFPHQSLLMACCCYLEPLTPSNKADGIKNCSREENAFTVKACLAIID